MPVLRELLARELLMLVVLAAIGAGPASLLSTRFRAIERAALAPILGMCLGTCVFTTLIYFFPANDTNWLVPVLAVASLALAAARSRTTRGWWRGRANIAGWLSIALVIIIVTAPILSVMRSQHTIGPASYAVGDAIGYVAETDAETRQSLHDSVYRRQNPTDLEQRYMSAYAQNYQNLDLSPVSANVDSLTGLGSTDTWQAFLIAFLVAGALGAMAAVRWVLREGGELAIGTGGATAGVMFAGALFLQLYFADSQSGVCGLCVLLPLGAIAADTVIEPRWRSLAVLAVPVAGLCAIYPLFVAPSAATAGAALLYLALRRWRSKRPRVLADIGLGVLRVLFVVAVAACLNLVSFTRDLRYWKALLTGALSSNVLSLPVFDMKADTVPSWLFQTRNLFAQLPLSGGGAKATVEEIVLPVVFVAVIAVGLRRLPVLCWLLIVIAVAAALGEYEAAKYACSYCTDRSVLPVAPILVGLLAAGIGVLLMSDRALVKVAGAIVLLAWLLPAFTAERDLRHRVIGGGTFLTSSARVALAGLPRDASVAVEGFDAYAPMASPNDPFAFELAEERSGGHATLPDDISNSNALAYFGIGPLSGGQFNPYYRYVLTRLPGIATARRTLARSDGVALQERVQPLDVILDGGYEAPPERADPSGTAWMSNLAPMRLIAAGPGSAPAYIGVKLSATIPVQARRQRGVLWRWRGIHEAIVCARARGTAPYRYAQISARFDPIATPVSANVYAGPPIGIGVRIQAIAVATRHCPFGP